MTAHGVRHGHSHRLQFSVSARVATYSILGTTWITGLGWLLLHRFFRRAGEFGLVPHPLEPWAQRLHGASAFAALCLLGALWVAHVLPAWRRKSRPLSGIAVLATLLALAVTGYVLYYMGSEDARARVAVVHWVIGLAAVAPLLIHVLRRR